nr:sigma-70 family RNA polymerase sigma factor [Pseudenhygromyxa sp. WMMC2535]
MRGAAVERRDPRQEVRDFTQEVFVQLLSQGGKTLRSWDPERGRSLESFVRLVARRQVAAILRSGRRNPWSEKPLAGEDLEPALPTASDASKTYETQEQLDRVIDALRDRLDERGQLLFQMLYVEERSVEEVMRAAEMTRDAVYAWRSRFRKLVANLEPSQESRPGRQISDAPKQGIR